MRSMSNRFIGRIFLDHICNRIKSSIVNYFIQFPPLTCFFILRFQTEVLPTLYIFICNIHNPNSYTSIGTFRYFHRYSIQR